MLSECPLPERLIDSCGSNRDIQSCFATQRNWVSALAGLMGYSGVSNAALLNLYDATLATLASGSSVAANAWAVSLRRCTRRPRFLTFPWLLSEAGHIVS